MLVQAGLMAALMAALIADEADIVALKALMAAQMAALLHGTRGAAGNSSSSSSSRSAAAQRRCQQVLFGALQSHLQHPAERTGRLVRSKTHVKSNPCRCMRMCMALPSPVRRPPVPRAASEFSTVWAEHAMLRARLMGDVRAAESCDRLVAYGSA